MKQQHFTVAVRIRIDQKEKILEETKRLSSGRGELVPLSKYLQWLIDEHFKEEKSR